MIYTINNKIVTTNNKMATGEIITHLPGYSLYDTAGNLLANVYKESGDYYNAFKPYADVLSGKDVILRSRMDDAKAACLMFENTAIKSLTVEGNLFKNLIEAHYMFHNINSSQLTLDIASCKFPNVTRAEYCFNMPENTKFIGFAENSFNKLSKADGFWRSLEINDFSGLATSFEKFVGFNDGYGNNKFMFYYKPADGVTKPFKSVIDHFKTKSTPWILSTYGAPFTFTGSRYSQYYTQGYYRPSDFDELLADPEYSSWIKDS